MKGRVKWWNTSGGYGFIELNSEDSIIDKHTIRVYKGKKEISQFIKKLIDKGYEVNEFKLETITLEDAFLKKAGGNKID